MDENKNLTEEVKPTFDELLKDPDYQAEFDRKAEGMREKWEAKWQKKAEKERSEAEKLAKMTAEEQTAYKIAELEKALEEKTRLITSADLKNESNKFCNEKGINTELLELIDFGRENAESIKPKLDFLEKWQKTQNEKYAKDVEDGINERLKQPTPTSIRSNTVTSEEEYLNKKYGDNPFYKKK